jgi:hypothetical protein
VTTMRSPPGDVDASALPTPRLSAMWQLHAELAKKLSEELRERELPLSMASATLDTRRAAMLRNLRNAVDYYRARFAAWPNDKTVTIEQKARDQQEFSALTGVVTTVLAP